MTMMTAKTQVSERRKYPRVERILSVQYRVKRSKMAEEDKTTWYNSNTYDMSVDGLAFIASRPFLVGDILELRVVMSGVLDVVRAHGRIVRVEDMTKGRYLVGVQLKKHL